MGSQNRELKKRSRDSAWCSGESEGEGLAGAMREPAITLDNPVKIKPHVVGCGWVYFTFCASFCQLKDCAL